MRLVALIAAPDGVPRDVEVLAIRRTGVRAFYIIVFRDSAVSILQGTWHDLDSIAHSLGQFLNRLSATSPTRPEQATYTFSNPQ